MKPTPTIRCAIYTRKSTEEGLEKEFNTLDAQREAAEAFITSQKVHGWKLIPTRYDDGGFSGGNTERPALRRLMVDIEAGLVDCIVVYKVDRLSRSLLDFVQILQSFERKQVAFVSVTQAFNTTTSMGRLTLNILLSFAQFEREIIAERIRDKMAASRRKGKWTGGRPILGYDVAPEGRGLLVNEGEAAVVRILFATYLRLRSISAVVSHAQKHGWRNKRWLNRRGVESGGAAFTKSQMSELLNNPLYLGKVTYKDELHRGEHPPIIDAMTFDAVQRTLLDQDRTGGAINRIRHHALLRGILRCGPCGCGMTHSYRAARGGSRAYRHYVCQNRNAGTGEPCPTPWLPAEEVERLVLDQIAAIGADEALVAEVLTEMASQAATAATESASRLAAAEKDAAACDRALRKVASGHHAIDPTELADLNDRLRKAENAVREERIQHERASQHLPNANVGRTALRSFIPVLQALSPAEQTELMSALLTTVTIDAGRGSLILAFRPTGIAALLERADPTEVAP